MRVENKTRLFYNRTVSFLDPAVPNRMRCGSGRVKLTEVRCAGWLSAKGRPHNSAPTTTVCHIFSTSHAQPKDLVNY
jgi:hypothetical protein